MGQNERVLSHLKTYGVIDHFIAVEIGAGLQIKARINHLRKMGNRIKTVMFHSVETSSEHGKYFLLERGCEICGNGHLCKKKATSACPAGCEAAREFIRKRNEYGERYFVRKQKGDEWRKIVDETTEMETAREEEIREEAMDLK